MSSSTRPRRPAHHRFTGSCLAVVVGALALGGCSTSPAPGSGGGALEPTGAVAVPSSPPASGSAPPHPAAPAAPAAPASAVIATVITATAEVFSSPGGASSERTISADRIVSLPGETPLTLLVAERQADWVRVHLPVRPNGTTGWIRMSDVTLSSTDFRVEVRLREHRLLLHRGGDVVLDAPVGVGRAEVPTPGGVYYIKELLQPPEQPSPYGTYAYGLSGFSPVLEQFAGGQGVIGIHGTDEPESVGTDASHGCIRMRNDDITRLVEEFGLPLGTPVQIIA